jgi:hypothetical protein
MKHTVAGRCGARQGHPALFRAAWQMEPVPGISGMERSICPVGEKTYGMRWHTESGMMA